MIKDGNFAGLLKTLAGIGVQAIELCSPLGYEEFATPSDGKQVRKVIADHGLTCDSAHFGMKELRTRQAQAIAWAHDVGITQMVTATLGAGDKPTMDVVKRAADEYNAIAARARKEGIQQGLHNEGFELSQVDGRRTYDVLFELLDPALVKFQFQMSTISQRLRGARVLHEVSRPVQLDARAGRGSERRGRRAGQERRGAAARRCPSERAASTG